MSEVSLLAAQDVTKHFDTRDGFGRHVIVRAVENVTLRLHSGRIAALVGESGSGKTTLARLLAQFYPVTSGEILLRGEPVKGAGKDFYSDVQLVFQDPFASLNSLRRVDHNLRRALKLHGHPAEEEHIRELLEKVNLTPAADFARKLPHELSGGQRQRVAIARALAVRPAVLLGDEPISMLDVSIRLDVLNLLAQLRDEEGLALLYITHDIASARYVSDEIYVMYAGQMVEGGPAESVIQDPKHPYTRLLVDSSPDPGRATFASTVPPGEPPSLVDPPPGCRFHPRCPLARAECTTEFPPRVDFPDGTWTNCWLNVEDE
ncbi:ABC transporter ATP-binding protein [Nonomuraea sp. NPDC000554]|uniref:ABC transporter ATP-binding protein n=1 Tax=Nonomuraea sp. NPDC000554 TaxID=3154259 RepID=UPI00331CB849